MVHGVPVLGTHHFDGLQGISVLVSLACLPGLSGNSLPCEIGVVNQM